MGYTTDFEGAFELDRQLEREHRLYLTAFNETRRMRRNPDIAAKLEDPIRKAVGLPIGPEAAYFVGGKGFMGQDEDASIIDYNRPPVGQPGLWCQWRPDDEGWNIKWDGAEKFYYYVDWLQYLLNHFLKPWGYTLHGTVYWQGEDPDDRGRIVVDNNDVKTQLAQVTYE